jgi:hypothetical protein
VRNAATLLRAKPDGHAAPMPQACYSGRPMHRSASQNRRRRRPSFKPVLIEVLRTGYLSAADKVHIKKWMNSEAANDFIPDKVVADPIIRKDIISYALHARQIAEAARHGDDLLRRERQQQRDELLALTKKSEDLAAYFRSVEQYSGIAAFFQRFFLPVRSLWMLHEYEAKLLRQRASREPPPTTFISRQTGGGKTKRRRARSREYNAFIVFMVMRMNDEFGKPYYGVVASLTNMVYSEAAVSSADVEAAWRRGQAYIRRNTRALEKKNRAECTASFA